MNLVRIFNDLDLLTSEPTQNGVLVKIYQSRADIPMATPNQFWVSRFLVLCCVISFVTGRPDANSQSETKGCFSGWTHVGIKCYKIFSKPKSYFDAAEDCEAHASRMATNNDATMAFLQQKNAGTATSLWVTSKDSNNCDYIDTTGGAAKLNRMKCGEKTAGYICQQKQWKLKEGCPKGFGWRDKCYFTINDEHDLVTSQRKCWRFSSVLATIHDRETLNFLSKKIKGQSSELWIGLHRFSDSLEYTWLNGDPVKYLPWSASFKGNRSPRCVAVHPRGKLFAAADCSKEKPVLCQTDRVGEWSEGQEEPRYWLEDCPDHWLQHKEYCYAAFEKGKSWDGAQDQCKEHHNADLVSIHNQEESDFIKKKFSYLKTRSIWIGLRRDDINTPFYWSDRTPFNFAKWEDGEPHKWDQECTELSFDSMEWKDVKCNYHQHRYVCKKWRGVYNPTKPETSSTKTDPLSPPKKQEEQTDVPTTPIPQQKQEEDEQPDVTTTPRPQQKQEEDEQPDVTTTPIPQQKQEEDEQQDVTTTPTPQQKQEEDEQPDVTTTPTPQQKQEEDEQPDVTTTPTPQQKQEEDEQPDVTTTPIPQQKQEEDEQPDVTTTPTPQQKEEEDEQPDVTTTPTPQQKQEEDEQPDVTTTPTPQQKQEEDEQPDVTTTPIPQQQQEEEKTDTATTLAPQPPQLQQQDDKLPNTTTQPSPDKDEKDEELRQTTSQPAAPPMGPNPPGTETRPTDDHGMSTRPPVGSQVDKQYLGPDETTGISQTGDLGSKYRLEELDSAASVSETNKNGSSTHTLGVIMGIIFGVVAVIIVVVFVTLASGRCGTIGHFQYWQSKRAGLDRKQIDESEGVSPDGGDSQNDRNTLNKHARTHGMRSNTMPYQKVSYELNAMGYDNVDLPGEGFNNEGKFSDDPVLLKATSLSTNDQYVHSDTTVCQPPRLDDSDSARLVVDAEIPSNGKRKSKKKSSSNSEDMNGSVTPGEKGKDRDAVRIENPFYNTLYDNSNGDPASSM